MAPQPQERTPLKDAARVYADRTSAAIVRLIATCNSRVPTPHTPQRPQTWTSWRALTHHAHHRGPEALCGVACAACVPQMGESWNHRYGSPLITPESTSGAALEAAFKARRNASPAASAVRPQRLTKSARTTSSRTPWTGLRTSRASRASLWSVQSARDRNKGGMKTQSPLSMNRSETREARNTRTPTPVPFHLPFFDPEHHCLVMGVLPPPQHERAPTAPHGFVDMARHEPSD